MRLIKSKGGKQKLLFQMFIAMFFIIMVIETKHQAHDVKQAELVGSL
jgi:hypothetical protein